MKGINMPAKTLFTRASVNISQCLGVLRTITASRQELGGQDLPVGHILEADFDKLCSPVPFINSDRGRIENTINELIYGALDLQGLPRITVSAEHVAAIIAFFVSPVNFMVASVWCERKEKLASHEDIVEGRPEVECDHINASQLYALITEAYGHESFPKYKERWETKTRRALAGSNSEEEV